MPLQAVVTLIQLPIDRHQRRSIIICPPRHFVEIGRASKAEDKHLQPEPDNGWFDSRVMSRHHARIALDPEQKSLYVRDEGSLHGTFVNYQRLRSGVYQTLYNEDILTFGAQVTRGSETFDPLKFRVELSISERSRSPPSDPVPVTSLLEQPKPEEPQQASINTFSVPDNDDFSDDDFLHLQNNEEPEHSDSSNNEESDVSESDDQADDIEIKITPDNEDKSSQAVDYYEYQSSEVPKNEGYDNKAVKTHNKEGEPIRVEGGQIAQNNESQPEMVQPAFDDRKDRQTPIAKDHSSGQNRCFSGIASFSPSSSLVSSTGYSPELSPDSSEPPQNDRNEEENAPVTSSFFFPLAPPPPAVDSGSSESPKPYTAYTDGPFSSRVSPVGREMYGMPQGSLDHYGQQQGGLPSMDDFDESLRLRHMLLIPPEQSSGSLVGSAHSPSRSAMATPMRTGPIPCLHEPAIHLTPPPLSKRDTNLTNPEHQPAAPLTMQIQPQESGSQVSTMEDMPSNIRIRLMHQRRTLLGRQIHKLEDAQYSRNPDTSRITISNILDSPCIGPSKLPSEIGTEGHNTQASDSAAGNKRKACDINISQEPELESSNIESQPNAQPRDFWAVAETPKLSVCNSLDMDSDSPIVEHSEPPRKSIKVETSSTPHSAPASSNGSNIGRYVASALAGMVIGGVGMIGLLTSLPVDFFE